MSWETLVVGHFKLKEDIGEDIEKKIISELEEVLECEIKYDDGYDEYEFEDVNWVSHVRGDKIKEVVEKYKDYFVYFESSVFYLNEADENISLSDGKIEAQVFE